MYGQYKKVICPKCKNKIEIMLNQIEIVCTFCGHRGRIKTQTQQYQQPTPIPQIPMKKRCQRCFTEGSEEDLFCIECGAKL